MSSRKNRLKSLFAGDEPAQEGAVEPQRAPSAPVRAPSAAVKAMGLSLGVLSQEADEARKLREMIAEGERVVELDPALLERSPFLDRLSDGPRDDPDFEALKLSFAEHGQQVPVLVRPHPDREKAARGMYQIAYGHRRVRAARELGRAVQAVVRDLDDSTLALAQGKENAERRGLSFVERAFFAQTLLDHGFDRATAQSALAVHKSEMSRLLQVAEAVPLRIARAIGPAPKAGRPRWIALGELLAADRAGFADDEITRQEFRQADSDARFQRLFDRLKASAARRQGTTGDKAKTVAGVQGRAIAEIARSGRTTRITIAESAGSGFADYVAERLPELHAAFEAAGGGKTD